MQQQMPMNYNYYPYQYQPSMQGYVPNPYLDRLTQLQQFQQSLQPQQQIQQPTGIIGKVVNDFSSIAVNDVPMDGRPAIFPKADMSEIQAKSWGSDGKILTTVYKPVLDNGTINSDETATLPADISNAIMQRFDDIAQRIERLEHSVTTITNPTSVDKKGADSK